ncbi:hypothetical protein [Pseudonocardia pini]|uniref:hypothetical protein n=1 Tax=Pseudonocardia pini TaxID=2758030 RepID=UPI0015EFEE54|nr:hypothetical protein [Pseudonocardia pini]
MTQARPAPEPGAMHPHDKHDRLDLGDPAEQRRRRLPAPRPADEEETPTEEDSS